MWKQNKTNGRPWKKTFHTLIFRHFLFFHSHQFVLLFSCSFFVAPVKQFKVQYRFQCIACCSILITPNDIQKKKKNSSAFGFIPSRSCSMYKAQQVWRKLNCHQKIKHVVYAYGFFFSFFRWIFFFKGLLVRKHSFVFISSHTIPISQWSCSLSLGNENANKKKKSTNFHLC